jgi:diadenosine tetraphosphate (Ap4A) HIT family hydrolase
MKTRTWPDDWDERLAGAACPMCANQGEEATEFGLRILNGRFADVALQRVTPLQGYAVGIWNRGHVAEPTDLDETAAAGYWSEVLDAARAIKELFAPAKLNFLTLGNSVPHLHTHILPRYLDDPAPGRPLPWDLIETAPPLPDGPFRRQVDDLRALIGPRGH